MPVPLTRSPLLAAGLLVAGLLLAGCGGAAADPGTAPSAGAPSSAPASSAAPGSEAPSSAAPSSAPSGAASSTPGTTGAGAADPCRQLDAASVSRLTGVEVKDGSTQDVGSSKVCTWAPQDGTAKDAAVFSAQEGPLPAGLGQVADQLKTQFNGKVAQVSVRGADDARYITGTTSGLQVADVLAAKDGRFYQVLVASPRDAEVHKDGAVKVAEALLKA